ncbi:MAG: PqqD family protein [Clostridia bacterium]|nr:PqqD family protein [Clostridia bacterium]
MKIKKGFILREVSKEEGLSVVVGVGENAQKLKGYMTLNESGTFIWKMLEKGATESEIVSAILAEYDAEEEVVKKDVSFVISQLKEIGAIDD